MVGSCGKTETDIAIFWKTDTETDFWKTDQKNENRYWLKKPIPTQLYRERRANAVGRAVSDQDRDQTSECWW